MLILLFSRDFSEYWRDVAKGMPPECADNVGRAVLFFDDTIESRDPGRMIDLRDALGLQQIIHFDDVASVRMSSSYLVTRLKYLIFLPSTSVSRN